jgi:hypothetical protein
VQVSDVATSQPRNPAAIRGAASAVQGRGRTLRTRKTIFRCPFKAHPRCKRRNLTSRCYGSVDHGPATGQGPANA